MPDEEATARPLSGGMTRRLAAILHADVKGYSRLIGEAEAATLRTLTPYLEMLSTLVRQHGGRVVGSRGDSLLAEFPSVVAAVQCAVEMQRELHARNAALPEARRVEFRMGINLGEIVEEGGQIHGDGINVAVRLEGLAEAGGICLSEVVYKQVKNRLALGYADLGEHTLKNIAEPVRVYRVMLDGTADPPARREETAGVQTSRRGIVLSQRQKKVTVAAIGLVLLVIVAAALRHLYFQPASPPAVVPSEQTTAPPLPDKPSIAVLPFVNMSGDPEQEYFGDGITVDLITDLSKLSDLVVIFGYSVFPYKGKAVKVQEVGRELGVRYVLEGSVRKAKDRVLITAQLVDATTAHHLWAERYDRPLHDLFAVQEEVRRKIVVHLGLKLTDEEQAQLERVYTSNLEAYDYVNRGMGFYSRATPAGNTQARQLWEKAIELDPTYALAYALAGWTYFIEWVYQWSHDPQAPERAFDLAQQALALDDSLPHAHELLALIYLWRDKQHEQALAAVKRSLTHSPNWFSGYVVLGLILNYAGRPEETIGLQEQAMRLSPQSGHYLPVLGESYRLMGRYEEAIAIFKKALALNPNQLGAHLTLAAVYSELGREAEARAEVAEVLRLNPQFSLEVHKQRTPIKDPAALERQLAALRKAGLQ